jgi:hypothetical protein
MTWGGMIDTRRTLATFGLVILSLVVGIFLFISILANGRIITTNPSAPPIPTVIPIR